MVVFKLFSAFQDLVKELLRLLKLLLGLASVSTMAEAPQVSLVQVASLPQRFFKAANPIKLLRAGTSQTYQSPPALLL